MSTRGIVAREVDDDAWIGFEIPADAYPEWAGAEVLRLLRACGLAEFCRRTREARLFPKMHVRATLASHETRGDLQWAYFIDPRRRTLRVFSRGIVASTHAPKLAGRWGEVAVHELTDDGGCQPPTMNVTVPVPWPLFPVTNTWELTNSKETDAHAVARLENRRKLERDSAAAGLETSELIRSIASTIADTLTAPFGRDRERRVFIAMEWTSDSFYWSVQLGDLEVRYPATAWSRTGAVASDATGAQRVGVFAEPDGTATIDMQYDAIVERSRERAILVSALPRAGWLFWFFDVVRAHAIPDLRGEELERQALPPRLADDWETLVHPDGRIWSIRRSKTGYQLRLGDPADDPIFKERTATPSDYDVLVREQLAEGFARR